MRGAPTRIILWLALGLAFFTLARGDRRFGPSPLDTIGKSPSQELGWEILKEFRSMGVAGDYSFSFELRVMPRRGDEKVFYGTMLGSRNERGPITRIDVVERPIEVGGKAEEPTVLRMLLQSGPSPYVMMARSDGDAPPEAVGVERLFEPIAGSDFTAFDLLMPYVYWQRFYYEGRTEFRSRPTHQFWMYPPDEDEALQKLMSGVRIMVNDQFKVMFQAQLFGPDRELQKTLSVLDLKEVDGEWIVGAVDLRNELTGGKTRFQVIDASVGPRLPRAFFEPQSLTRNLPVGAGQGSQPANFEAVK